MIFSPGGLSDMKKIAVPILSVMLLSGCAAPVAVTVVSLVADGISYITTEKSLTDHGLSAISDSDCAMYRIITTGYACQPYDVEDIAVAETKVQDVETPLPGVYMVIASGRDHRMAERVAAHFDEISPDVFAQSSGPGKDIFRVVAGPITQSQYPAARAYAAKRGVHDVWALMIEDDDWRSGKAILAAARQAATETASNQ